MKQETRKNCCQESFLRSYADGPYFLDEELLAKTEKNLKTISNVEESFRPTFARGICSCSKANAKSRTFSPSVNLWCIVSFSPCRMSQRCVQGKGNRSLLDNAHLLLNAIQWRCTMLLRPLNSHLLEREYFNETRAFYSLPGLPSRGLTFQPTPAEKRSYNCGTSLITNSEVVSLILFVITWLFKGKHGTTSTNAMPGRWGWTGFIDEVVHHTVLVSPKFRN